MEVIKASECFINTPIGLKFIYTHILFQQDGILYHGQSPSRRYSPGDTLSNITPVPSTSYQPIAPPGCTVAPISDDFYIKTPNLTSFDSIDLNHLVLNELSVCEILKRHPHPNIATFHGCKISDIRITGLCFSKYPSTLLQKVNPGFLNKAMLVCAADRKTARAMAVSYLPGIEAGVKHLHSLGLAHNDLNPSNVMISEDGTPIIIDFDSCSVPGTDLRQLKRGTHGWFDPEVVESRFSNDLDALREMHVYLTSDDPEDFLFKDQ